MTAARYAVYFAPEEGAALAEFGWTWLGRPDGGIMDVPQADLVAEPAFYGFHATLKAPFRPADGTDEASLRAAMRDFSHRRSAFTEPPLVPERLDGYLALRPSRPSPAIEALAADCVRSFDRFRAPLTEQEKAKRLAAPLTPRQKDLLATWGYPYVLEEYRFHMTLTRRLAEDEVGPVHQRLMAKATAALAQPVAFRSLCLFKQPAPDQPFFLAERFPFGEPSLD